MDILIDSSVWIDYFRGSEKDSDILNSLIDEDIICTNNLILTEIISFLHNSKNFELIDLLNEIPNIPLNINWNNIIDYQTTNLKNGINMVGIPDLIILDNVIQNDLVLFSHDKHFKLINEFIPFKSFNSTEL